MFEAVTTDFVFLPGNKLKAQHTGHEYTIPEKPLTGVKLLDFVKLKTILLPVKSELVAAAGHLKGGPFPKPNFISFYEALLYAKREADPNYSVTVGEAIEDELTYDELSKPLQELYDVITEKFGEKWTHQETLDFMGELDDLGISTENDLENAFYSVVDNDYRWERQFAENLVCELEPSLQDSYVSSYIDWQGVWDHSLTYDYHTIEFDGSVFIFYANW